MTDNSNTESVDIDNFAEFEAEFYQTKDKANEDQTPEDSNEEVEDIGEDAPANDEDTDAPEGDEDALDNEESEQDDQEADEEDSEAAEDQPVKKRRKSEYQERINELTRARREAERREQMLLQRLEALEADARNKETETPVQQRLPEGAPSPDAVDKNGEPVYALGEFDPNYIRDLTLFMATSATNEAREKARQEAEAAAVARQQAELQSQWENKLQEAEEETPEIREHIADLVDTIQNMNVDPAYGDYLATTVMQSENGPAILEYLSQNIGEAQKIVASGPAAATLAIGRLDAKLSGASPRPNEEEKRNVKLPTSRTPPPVSTKGRGTKTQVRGDTDNLDDFEKAFYG